MKSQAPKRKIASQNVFNEILTQLAKRNEVLRGVEVTVLTKELVLRQGKYVVKETHEEHFILGEEHGLKDLDPSEIFTNPKYALEELPGIRHDLIRIRAKPAHPGKFNIANPCPEDHQAAIAIISKSPARLIEVRPFLVNLPWWIKWLIKSFEANVEFDYIRGVPVPRKGFGHMQSKGIGRWRIGGGDEIEIWYKE